MQLSSDSINYLIARLLSEFLFNEFLSEAVHYAIASGDLEFLADVVDRGLSKNAIWSGGNLTLYAAWLDALPPQAFQSRPALSLNASHIIYLLGRFDLAEKQIDRAEKTLHALPVSPEKEQMLALASLYRGAIASVRGDTPQAIERITFAQERLPQEHQLQHARGFFSLGLAYELSGQTELAVQNYLKSSEETKSAGVLFLVIHALGAGAADGVRLLRPETHRLMTSNQLTDSLRGSAALLSSGYGFGLEVAVVLDPEKTDPIICGGGVGSVGWPGAWGG